MSIVTAPPVSSLPPARYPMRRFSVEEYHRLIETAILTEDDPVELLEGWIIQKKPHNPPHDSTIDQAQELLEGILPAGWRVRIQSAITTPDSEPEPGVAVVLGPARRYADHHPRPSEIGLLVEVSDSTLQRDREVKLPIYARAGVPYYWIVNLPERQVEVYSMPTLEGKYQERVDFKEDGVVAVMIGGQEVGRITVRELLPAAEAGRVKGNQR